MIVLNLYCPACHCASGNAITVDWPEPLEPHVYSPLICAECGRDFTFGIDGANGMRCWITERHVELTEFLARRKGYLTRGPNPVKPRGTK